MKQNTFYFMFLVIFSLCLAGCGTPNPPVGDFEKEAEDMKITAALAEELDRMAQVEQLGPKIFSDEIGVLEEDMK